MYLPDRADNAAGQLLVCLVGIKVLLKLLLHDPLDLPRPREAFLKMRSNRRPEPHDCQQRKAISVDVGQSGGVGGTGNNTLYGIVVQAKSCHRGVLSRITMYDGRRYNLSRLAA